VLFYGYKVEMFQLLAKICFLDEYGRERRLSLFISSLLIKFLPQSLVFGVLQGAVTLKCCL
jgi:hypothetical protein